MHTEKRAVIGIVRPTVKPATMSVDEVARYLGLSSGSVWKAIRAGEIPSFRIGVRTLVPIVELKKRFPILASSDPWEDFESDELGADADSV